MLQLILGGARSGQSRLAEQIAQKSQKTVIYIATAQANDAEMQQRIQHHQQQRPTEWQLIEEQLYLAECLEKNDVAEQIILVDCLTLWMSNLLMHSNPDLQMDQCRKLLAILPQLKSDIIIVSNETGLGVVPMGEITRKFVYESVFFYQQLCFIAEKVVFCVAGFPMILKGEKE